MKKQLLLLLWSSVALFAQAPNISYPSGTYTFDTGTAITPLSPTNTGGSVPATIYGQVSTFAGSKGVYGSADGVGTSATFFNPNGLAVDAMDNVYVADTSNNKIRKITSAGIVTTLAGSGVYGSADGVGAAASFRSPYGVAVDNIGNVYVADLNNQKIRKITPTGVVTTLAGSGFYNPTGVAVDKEGNVYVADSANNKIKKITPAGGVTTLAGSGLSGSNNGIGADASFSYPSGVAVDASGSVYIANTNQNDIKKCSPSSYYVNAMAGIGTSGSIDGWTRASMNGSTPSNIILPSFNSPRGLAVNAAGIVYIADLLNNKIRVITPENNYYKITTLAGSGLRGFADGVGNAASFNHPFGVAVDLSGNVYVADQPNQVIRKIIATGYSIYPNLPAGLNFDSTTGIISGTPAVASVSKNYSITAYNLTGNSSTMVAIATSTLGTTTFGKQELKLYPNPVTSLLHIQTPNTTNIDNVIISDLTGKKVLEQTQNTSQVNVAHLAKGVYIIEAFSGKEKFSSKFMKE